MSVASGRGHVLFSFWKPPSHTQSERLVLFAGASEFAGHACFALSPGQKKSGGQSKHMSASLYLEPKHVHWSWEVEPAVERLCSVHFCFSPCPGQKNPAVHREHENAPTPTPESRKKPTSQIQSSTLLLAIVELEFAGHALHSSKSAISGLYVADAQ